MPESETLVTMAEVAAAFAGFTALASVFSGTNTRDHPTVSARLLRVMIEASLLVVFFSLLPLILAKTPLSLPSVWRICSGICVAVWLGFVALLSRSSVAAHRETQAPYSRWYITAVVCSLTLGNGILLLVAFGAIDSWAGGAYSLGLYFALLNAAFSFARFFFGAYDHSADGPAG